MKFLAIFYITIALIFGSAWGFNFYKLVNCDWEAPYRCEAVHSVGLIPLFSVITVWFASDKS